MQDEKEGKDEYPLLIQNQEEGDDGNDDDNGDAHNEVKEEKNDEVKEEKGDEVVDVDQVIEEVDDHVELKEEDDSDEMMMIPRRSTRTVAPSLKNLEQYAYTTVNCLRNEQVFMVGDDEPKTFKQAMKRDDKDRWQEAINAEIASLLKKETWRHIDKEEERRVSNPITARWVFKIKRKADMTIERYKARMVAKGFTQKYGIDFVETFAPVARMGSVRILLSIACNMDYNLMHWDVDTAFLNPTLKEDIYMYLPEGVPFEGSHIVKLLKGLYGLKQASREWYEMVEKIMVELGFMKSEHKPCIFILRRGDVIIIVDNAFRL